MPALLRDVRYAVRTLRRSPAFTVVAILTLALGIGANTAIFSVFSSVLLQPLDYRRPDRLVAIFEAGRQPTSPANFLRLREASQRLEELTAAHPFSPVLRGRDRPEQLQGLKASPSLFRLLGAEPALGRTFPQIDDEAEAANVVVIGHHLWQRRFGGDPEILGQALSLDGEDYAVIGVMPPGFEFPPFWATGAELWVPLTFAATPPDRRLGEYLRLFGRLAPETRLSEALAEVAVLTEQLRSLHPQANASLQLEVEPLREPVVGGVRGGLTVLLGTVGLVLLIACANVANLFLGRASGRRGEIAVRLALGAGRASLIRQLLTESLVLALAASAVGLLLGLWGVEALVALAPENVPRLAEIGLDGGVLAYTLAISLLTGFLFGLFPSLAALRWDQHASLRQGGHHIASRRGGRARALLVVAEVSLALMLLIGAGLTLKSLSRLWQLDPGFRTGGVLTLDLSLAGSTHAETERQNPFFEALVGEIEEIPGVADAALINHLPIGGDIWGTRFQIEGRRAASLDDSPRATTRTVTPKLFATMGVPVLHGRPFDERDREDSQPVVIVSRRLAERYWGTGDVVGRRVQPGGPDSEEPWHTIVGVVGDVRQWQLTDELTPGLYSPYRQNPVSWFLQTTLVVLAEGEPKALEKAAVDRIWELAPGIPVARVRTMEDILSRSVWQERFNASLLALFAALALVLAAVGIYGVMGYAVARRRAEIGVRMALGAGRGQILRLIVGQGMWLTAAGLACGLVGAWSVARFLGSLLFGVGVHDLPTFLAVPLLLALVALAACYLPARRASRLDPVMSLRSD